MTNVTLSQATVDTLIRELASRGASIESHMSTTDLLSELAGRGGYIAALARAGLLCGSKAHDYHAEATRADPFSVTQDGYFPFGFESYATLVHLKTKRLVEVILGMQKSKTPLYDGVEEMFMDLANYALFGADYAYRLDPINNLIGAV